MTDTAKLAHVVLPATATWCEAEGTVTDSERRVQRVRKALEPPPGARDDIEIICEIARRLGTDWGRPSAEDLWNELRTLSPMHAGMSYRRLRNSAASSGRAPTSSTRVSCSCTPGSGNRTRPGAAHPRRSRPWRTIRR